MGVEVGYTLVEVALDGLGVAGGSKSFAGTNDYDLRLIGRGKFVVCCD